MNAEVKSGYKQTDAGIIPVDWDSRKLGQIGRVIRGSSPRPKGDRKYYGGNVPRLMVEDVTRDGKLVTPKVDFLTIEGAKRSRPCKAGTLTVVCSGTVGVPSFLAVDACIHDGFLGLVEISSSIHQDYLYHQLSSMREKFDASATHGGVFTNLTTTGFSEFSISVACKEEQIRIATALSDMDALISGLDQLIAKKRDIKQATMQQLLTGKKRLPGFSGEWEIWTIAQVAEISKGEQLPRKKAIGNGQFPHLNGGTSASGYTDKANTPANTIAISEGGNSCGYVQLMPSPFWCGGHCYAVTPKDIDNRLLYHALKSRQSEIMGLRVGSGLPNIQKASILEFKLTSPISAAEQAAIAAILSDMDAELATHESRRDKAKQLKQGMMQELLTGRIRLL